MTWVLLDPTAVQCASTGHIKMLLKALHAKQRVHEEKTWLCLPRGALAKRSSRTNVSRHYCMLCLGFCCWEHFLSQCSLQHSRSSQIPNCKSWHFSQIVGILWDVLVGLAMLVRFVVVRNKGRHFVHLRVKAWLKWKWIDGFAVPGADQSGWHKQVKLRLICKSACYSWLDLYGFDVVSFSMFLVVEVDFSIPVPAMPVLS